MEEIYQYILIGMYFLIPLGLLILLVWIIYRRLKGKVWYNSGTGFVAEHLYSQWETKGQKAAVEEIQYEREDKKEEAEGGEGKEPGFFMEDSEEG